MKNETERSHPTFMENWRLYLSDCCTNSSMHGFKFLGERNRSVVERFLWLLILAICVFFCIINILEAYYKWQLSPVVVSFATTETPVWEIPFPAVTICPEVKAEKKYVNFTELVLMTKRGEQLNQQQKKHLKYMSFICSNEWRDHIWEDGDLISEDFYEFLFEVHPKADETIDECLWIGRNCTGSIRSLFTPIITQDGICYSFNLLDRNDIFRDDVAHNYYNSRNIPNQRSSNWSLEKGYGDELDQDAMPRRTFIPGIVGGLQLTFWGESNNLDYICSDALQGYKVSIHGPSQIPFTDESYFRVGLNEVLVAAVRPMIVSTSKQLEGYHPDSRKCYFPEEKRLTFFKQYDQYNCVHECLSNYTLRRCGCVSFHMPRLNSTPICGHGKNVCVARSAAALFMVNKNKSEPDDSDEPDFVEKCDCRQTCSSLSFATEISQTEWRWQKRERALSEDGSRKKMKDEYSKLQIFYKDLQFITSERNELFGLMDFLSSCGGLFGLFMGFSFISLIELVYFFSLRLFCNYKKYGSHYWSGDADLLELKVE
ncbi:hypothetical protein RI129_011066 [Pyrocoelia pectoralis]|uniref:Pickpocket protein 28 n=1 Tax=Pyrocoelia pectoralis TaxID=417401 RepID=A0AAN7V0B0_9COLE